MPGLIKHACPGVHQPMAEADGGLARVRVPGGRLTIAEWEAIAGAAARHGSGTIEVTSRANVQLRGIGDARVPALVDDLVAAGVVLPDPVADPRRNVVGAPAAGLDPTERFDVGPIVDEIADRLARGTGALPPKAGVLVDGGGAISVRGRRADVALGAARLAATGDTVFEVRLAAALPLEPATDLVPVVRVADAPRLAVGLVEDRRRPGDEVRADEVAALLGDHVEWVPGDRLDRATPAGGTPFGTFTAADGTPFVGVAPVLGRLDAALAGAIASVLRDAGASELRLTPWRGLLAAVRDPNVLAALATLGLIVDAGDPAAGVIACAGATGCASGTVDTVADGLRLVDRMRARGANGGPLTTVHLSGCEKRCASHEPRDLTLVGDLGAYDGFDRRETVLFRRRAADDALGTAVADEAARKVGP